MAFTSDFILPGSFGSVTAYYMIQAISHDRVFGHAHVRLVAFANAAARQAYKAAADVVKRDWIALDQQRQAAAKLDQASPEAAAANAAIQTAQEVFIQAQQAVKQNDFLPDTTGEIFVSAADIASVLDATGNVSVAQVYAYLKTLPRFANATDV